MNLLESRPQKPRDRMSAVTPAKDLTIFVKEKAPGFVETYDLNDESMKVAIKSFEILKPGSCKKFSKRSAIVLHLSDLDSIGVKYLKDNEEFKRKSNHETDIVSLAVESVLKHLYKKGCVGKDCVAFQSVRESNGKQTRSVVWSILLNPNLIPPFVHHHNKGFISYCIACLTHREVYIYLNPSESLIIDKIKAVLKSLFPKKRISEYCM